jgi:hypothetical protein
VFDYAAAARDCRTPNDFNRLHIDLETVLTPREMQALSRSLNIDREARQARAWLHRLADRSPGMFVSPQTFARSDVHELVTHYSDSVYPSAQKRLLLAFSGNAWRLMLPIANILQCLDARYWDVVLIKRSGRRSLLRGIEGVADNLPGLVRFTLSRFPSARYRQHATLGTSGGGYPAAAAALLSGARRGVSVCSGLPKEPPRFLVGRSAVVARVLSAARGTELLFVHGEREEDRLGAEKQLRSFGGRLWPVAGVDHHNVFLDLERRGELAGFLNDVLVCEEKETANPIGLRRLIRRAS